MNFPVQRGAAFNMGHVKYIYRPLSGLSDRLHETHKLQAAQMAVHQKVYIAFLRSCPLGDGAEQDSTGDTILLKDRRKGVLCITNRPNHIQK